jgi:tRNA (cmo5U34)-methyltransferase
MLATAKGLFDAEGLQDRIELVQSDIAALPDEIANQPWDGISCVWTLHRLSDFNILRRALRQIAAVRERSGAAVWIFDFQRLRNPVTFPAMVSVLDPQMLPVLRKDAIASEAAAFTHDELDTELKAAGLTDLSAAVSRPMAWAQAFWVSRSDGTPGGSTDFRPGRLTKRAHFEATLLRSGFTARPC